MNGSLNQTANAGAVARLRIAILPAKFDARLSYQENNFAHALHDMGCEVCVFTSQYAGAESPASVAAADAGLPFRVIRSARVWRIRQTAIPWDWAMRGRIRAFDPQVAFVLAPNHGTGICWMKHLPGSCRIVVGFSDLPWHRGGFSTWLKRRWGRRAIRLADKVVTATADTQRLVLGWARSEDTAKIEQIGLTFLPSALEGGATPPEVAALAGRVRRIIACITRVSPGKQLDLVFNGVERWLMTHHDAGFVMAGFDDGPESQRLRALIAASPVADRCLVLPLLSPAEVGGIFRVAACSVWSLVSIGIYHSLHCGCPVLVREGQDATHLLSNPAAGEWFKDESQLAVALEHLLSQSADRPATSAVVARYHAEKVLTRLLQEVMATGSTL